MIKIYGDAKKVTKASIGGTPAALLLDWWDYAKGLSSNEADVQDGVATLQITHTKNVTVDEVMLAISNGFEVEGFTVFIEMTATKYNGNVPAGIPNRSVFDEEGNETILKWSEWHLPQNEHREIGTKYYVCSDANIAGTEPMKGSEFATLYGVSGYKLLTEEEYKALNTDGDGLG